MGVVIWKGRFPSSVTVAGVPMTSSVPKSMELLRHLVCFFVTGDPIVVCPIAAADDDDVVKALRIWLAGRYPRLCLTVEAKIDRIAIVVNRMIYILKWDVSEGKME